MNIRKTKGVFLKGNANIHGKCLLVSVAVAFVLCVVASVAEFEAGCENVRQNVLRLHVIANSNSDEDQTLKLKVRDAVLEAGEGVFGNGKTSEEAAMMISDNAQLLEDAAEKVITDNAKLKDGFKSVTAQTDALLEVMSGASEAAIVDLTLAKALIK